MSFQIHYKDHKLEKMGGSNNSMIYKILDPSGKETKKVLKLVPHHSHSHSHECKHLKNEYEILKKTKHTHIIESTYFFENIKVHNTLGCAIELELAQQDLFSLIESLYPDVLDLNFLHQIFKDLAGALEYLHETLGVTHNDIKLENILIDEECKAKLADFGFADSGSP